MGKLWLVDRIQSAGLNKLTGKTLVQDMVKQSLLCNALQQMHCSSH